MHTKNIITAGKKAEQGGKALIMIHGRGATAEDIITLAPHLGVDEFSLFAPEATNHTWYPYSFLSPPSENEPWLSSALTILKTLVQDINALGIATNQIYFVGFSQGACLTLEFTARNAVQYGGIIAFTGGLIGDRIYMENYSGDFAGTPVFIGSSNPDPHVPVERVMATTHILRKMNAKVTEKIYDMMGHTINQDEIDQARKVVLKNH